MNYKYKYLKYRKKYLDLKYNLQGGALYDVPDLLDDENINQPELNYCYGSKTLGEEHEYTILPSNTVYIGTPKGDASECNEKTGINFLDKNESEIIFTLVTQKGKINFAVFKNLDITKKKKIINKLSALQKKLNINPKWTINSSMYGIIEQNIILNWSYDDLIKHINETNKLPSTRILPPPRWPPPDEDEDDEENPMETVD